MADLVIDLMPQSKPHMSFLDKSKARPCVARYQKFVDLIRHYCQEAGYTFQNNVSMTFVFPIPKSWPKWKQEEMEGKPHNDRPPALFSLIESVQDALVPEKYQIDTYGPVRKIWGRKEQIIIHNAFNLKK